MQDRVLLGSRSQYVKEKLVDLGNDTHNKLTFDQFVAKAKIF